MESAGFVIPMCIYCASVSPVLRLCKYRPEQLTATIDAFCFITLISDWQIDSGSRIEPDSIHKVWIQLNWTQLVSSESDLSCTAVSAWGVEFELSWALWKVVMMNVSWVLTLSTSIPSKSESITLPERIPRIDSISQLQSIFFEPRRITWEFPTRHNEGICSRLLSYFYVYCITLIKVRLALFPILCSSIIIYQNVRVFGSKPS